MKQLTIQYTGTNSARPLMRSCGTWTHIKHSAMKNHYSKEHYGYI